MLESLQTHRAEETIKSHLGSTTVCPLPLLYPKNGFCRTMPEDQEARLDNYSGKLW